MLSKLITINAIQLYSVSTKITGFPHFTFTKISLWHFTNWFSKLPFGRYYFFLKLSIKIHFWLFRLYFSKFPLDCIFVLWCVYLNVNLIFECYARIATAGGTGASAAPWCFAATRRAHDWGRHRHTLPNLPQSRIRWRSPRRTHEEHSQGPQCVRRCQ